MPGKEVFPKNVQQAIEQMGKEEREKCKASLWEAKLEVPSLMDELEGGEKETERREVEGEKRVKTYDKCRRSA